MKLCGLMERTWALGSDRPEFESGFCSLPALWYWATYLMSLSFDFYIWKKYNTSHSAARTRWDKVSLYRHSIMVTFLCFCHSIWVHSVNRIYFGFQMILLVIWDNKEFGMEALLSFKKAFYDFGFMSFRELFPIVFLSVFLKIEINYAVLRSAWQIYIYLNYFGV